MRARIYSYNFRPKGIGDFEDGDTRLQNAELKGLEVRDRADTNFEGADMKYSMWGAAYQMSNCNFNGADLRYAFNLQTAPTTFRGCQLKNNKFANISQDERILRRYEVAWERLTDAQRQVWEGFENFLDYHTWVIPGFGMRQNQFSLRQLSKYPSKIQDGSVFSNPSTDNTMQLYSDWKRGLLLNSSIMENVSFVIGSMDIPLNLANALLSESGSNRGVRFEANNSTIKNCDFRGIPFSYFRTSNSTFENCKFDWCFFRGSNINIQGSQFINCTFRNTHWSGDWETKRRGYEMFPSRNNTFTNCDFSRHEFQDSESFIPFYATLEFRNHLKTVAENEILPYYESLEEIVREEGGLWRNLTDLNLDPAQFGESRKRLMWDNRFMEEMNSIRSWVDGNQTSTVYGDIRYLFNQRKNLRGQSDTFRWAFTNCEFNNCSFKKRKMNTSFRSCRMIECDFRETFFRGSNSRFLDTNLFGSNFNGSTINWTSFRKVEMEGVSMLNMKLAGYTDSDLSSWPSFIPKKNIRQLAGLSLSRSVVRELGTGFAEAYMRNRNRNLPNWRGE